jgi:hypothetical protein
MKNGNHPEQSPQLKIATLRLLVGFLGESRQGNWWDCAFISPTGRKFLHTVFPRTALQASIRSTGQAARIVHDSKIGRVGMFHLFRLPVDKEESLEGLVDEVSRLDISAWTASKDAALEELGKIASVKVSAPQGPVRIGVETEMLSPNAVTRLAAHYHSAFSGGFQCFPYFGAEAHAR